MTDVSTEAAATTPAETKKAPRRGSNLREYGLLAALVVIVLLFQWMTDAKLLSAGNPNNLISQNAYVVILALGMVMVIIAGHIDLSVGSIVAAVGALVAIAINYWSIPWPVAVLLALVVGALIGAWQGFWVAFVKVPAFIVTLAGMLIFRGLAIIFLTGGTIGGLPDGFVAIGARWVPSLFGHIGVDAQIDVALPAWNLFGHHFARHPLFILRTNELDTFTLVVGLVAVLGYVGLQIISRLRLQARNLPTGSLSGFIIRAAGVSVGVLFLTLLLAAYRGTPWVLVLLGVLVMIYSFVLNRTVFGRHIYAMGGNRFAAMMSGVKTRWVDFFIFVNIGVLSAIAAVVTTSRAGSANSAAGTWFELDAIASVFIGGAAVQGGVGRVSGSVIGALVMGVLNMGLSILTVDAAWQQVIKGLVLLLAVAFDVINRRRSGTA